MLYRHEFVVVGSTSFPIDMLRYDEAFPATEMNAGKIHQVTQPGTATGPFEIALQHLGCDKGWRPTRERWQSFGWRVTECGIWVTAGRDRHSGV